MKDKLDKYIKQLETKLQHLQSDIKETDGTYELGVITGETMTIKTILRKLKSISNE